MKTYNDARELVEAYNTPVAAGGLMKPPRLVVVCVDQATDKWNVVPFVRSGGFVFEDDPLFGEDGENGDKVLAFLGNRRIRSGETLALTPEEAIALVERARMEYPVV